MQLKVWGVGILGLAALLPPKSLARRAGGGETVMGYSGKRDRVFKR